MPDPQPVTGVPAEERKIHTPPVVWTGDPEAFWKIISKKLTIREPVNARTIKIFGRLFF